jgi:isoprenylcysteine carboxyl methyltransferase (ICMT) family protein YpbQ
MFFKKRPAETGNIAYGWSLTALILAYNLILLATLTELFVIKRHINFSISLIGLLLFIFAFIIRNWSINALGKFHSTNIEIKPNHHLITSGPYRYLRHPYYLSVMLEVISIPLTVNSFYAFYAAFIVYIPWVLIRVYLEEKVMLKTFGPEYQEYKLKVMAFLPLKRSFNRLKKESFHNLTLS